MAYSYTSLNEISKVIAAGNVAIHTELTELVAWPRVSSYSAHSHTTLFTIKMVAM